MSAHAMRSRAGFSLVELLITIVVFTIVFGAIMSLMLGVQRSYTSQRIAVKATDGLRAAQMTLGTVLRTAGADPAKRGIGLIDPDPMGTGVFDNLRVVSDFNPVDSVADDPLEDIIVYVGGDTLFVSWQAGAPEEVAAFPVESLLFEYFSSTGVQIVDPAQIARAMRVRVTIEAPADPRTGAQQRVQSWFYLRNRS